MIEVSAGGGMSSDINSMRERVEVGGRFLDGSGISFSSMSNQSEGVAP